MAFSAAELAKWVDGEVVGDPSVQLTGVAPAELAQPGTVIFAENEGYLVKAEKTPASAVIVGQEVTTSIKTLVRVKNPRVAFAKALALFNPPAEFPAGAHPQSCVDSTAQVDPTAHIGAFCSVGPRARIGAKCVIESGSHVGADCTLGDQTHLFPNVTLYARSVLGRRVAVHSGTVIGSDGFGYVFDQGALRKVPQIGHVIIEDDVEIGANVTIDRATLGVTRIGRGTKIDNLVMVAHNVQIGENCILISQVGIAGSTRLGNYVTLAGQVGLAGHLKIGNQVTVAAQSGIMSDIPDGEKWLGSPGMPDRKMKRILIGMQRVPELLSRVAELERKLEQLEKPNASEA